MQRQAIQPPVSEVPASRGKRKLLYWIRAVGVAAVIAAGWVLAWPVIRMQSKVANLVSTMNRGGSLGLALEEFDFAYGRYPDASTAAAVKAATCTPLTLGDGSSNQLFRQLIATGLKSEKPFRAWIPGSHEPDDRFDDDAHALAKGECGFAYIAGLSSSSSPGAPLLVCPLIPGTTRFDCEPFNGKAIVVRVDNSISSFRIGKEGRVMIDGMDLFDPRQPYWQGKAPDIKWPE